MKGAQRSVTPEAFSAGTTAKVSSGYLAFQSCADADAVNASAAAPARTMRRVIMVCPLVVVTRFRPIAALQTAALLRKASSGRRGSSERRNGSIVGRMDRCPAHDVIGLEVVEFARDEVGDRRRCAVEHHPPGRHADQAVAISTRQIKRMQVAQHGDSE